MPGKCKPNFTGICKNCGKEFETYISPSKMARGQDNCSKECFLDSHREKLTCDFCGVEFFRQKTRVREGFNFCCRACKDVAGSIDGGEKFNDMRPEHYNTTTVNYRKVGLRKTQECYFCGLNIVELLQAHHLDENRKNNSPENIIMLCSNHHLAVHKNLSEYNKNFRNKKFYNK